MSDYSKEAPVQRALDCFKQKYFDCSRVRKMAREWRYDLGEETRIAIMRSQEWVCIGWDSSDPEYKLRCYEKASGLILYVQHNLNTMNDVGALDNRLKAEFDLMTYNIRQQLLGMVNSQRSKVKLAKRRSIRDVESTDGELEN